MSSTTTHCDLAIVTHGKKMHEQIILVVDRRVLVTRWLQRTWFLLVNQLKFE